MSNEKSLVVSYSRRTSLTLTACTRCVSGSATMNLYSPLLLRPRFGNAYDVTELQRVREFDFSYPFGAENVCGEIDNWIGDYGNFCLLSCTWAPPSAWRPAGGPPRAPTPTATRTAATARRSSACRSNSWPPESPGNAPGTLQFARGTLKTHFCLSLP